MAEETDEAVIRRVLSGDAEAFGAIMRRYERKIERYARKFLFFEEDATDLVQDVFVKAYENLRSFDTSRSFSPWLYRIAHNEFVNALERRTRERVARIDIDTLVPFLRAPEEADADANRADVRALLERGLSLLSAKYREPLVLHYFEELSYEEIADVLRIPVSTVGVRLMRGRKALREAVERDRANSRYDHP